LGAQTYEQDFQQRATILTNQVADKYGNLRPPGFKNDRNNVPDPEKYNWPQVIARLKKYGNNDDTANARINRFKNNSPFHFTLVGMARIMSLFPQSPQMMAAKNTYIANIFSRSDKYNAFTDEGTENHNNMARTSGYLACQNALGNASFPAAANKMADSKSWIMQFSKNLLFCGSSEWNSSQYGAYNLIGWLNLFDFATDPEVKAAARAVLDYYALEIGLHYSQGWTGGSEMRSSGVPAFGTGNSANNFGTSSQDYLGWLWFGDLSRNVGTNYWQGNEYIQSIHAATSGYRPPYFAIQLARKQTAKPSLFKASKGEYFGKVPSFLHQNFYLDEGYNLGTAYVPYGGWGGGCFAIHSWKLVGKVNPISGDSVKAPQMITGAGRYYNQSRGRGRQPYDQFVQNKNVLIQMTKTPANAAQIDSDIQQIFATWFAKWDTAFAQRFSAGGAPNPVGKIGGAITNKNESYISYPTAANVVRTTNTVFIELENAFIAIRSLSKTIPATPVDDGNATRKMIVDDAALGDMCGFVLEAGNKTPNFSFANFQSAITSKNGLNKSQLASGMVTYISLQNETIEATYSINGNQKEPIFDWGYGPTTQQIFQTTPPYIQPNTWPVTNGGKVATWKVNGDPVLLDLNWPVYEGEGISLKNRILNYTGDSAGISTFYKVDYTGNIPVFTSGLVTDSKPLQTSLELKAEIFPNPATSSFSLRMQDGIRLEKVVIYSSNGILLRKFEGNKEEYSINGLKQGIYFVHVFSSTSTTFKKLIVK